MKTPNILVLKQTLGHKRCKLIKNTIKNGKVLDIGCGTGQNLILISKNIVSGVGIDISNERLKIAKKIAELNSLKNLKFENKSALENNFKKESFDWIICTEVLEHIENDELVLDNISKWLKKNGKLLITTPAEKMFTKINEKLRNYVGEPDHVRVGYNIQELSKRLEKKGFTIEKAEYYGQFFSTLIHYTSLLFARNKNVKIEKGEPKLISYYIYNLLWPILYLISRLDYLIPRSIKGGFLFIIAKK